MLDEIAQLIDTGSLDTDQYLCYGEEDAYLYEEQDIGANNHVQHIQ